MYLFRACQPRTDVWCEFGYASACRRILSISHAAKFEILRRRNSINYDLAGRRSDGQTGLTDCEIR